MVAYSWHTRYLFDLSDMDLSRDFTLVDGNLVFCAKDGIYCVAISNPENRLCLVSYPKSYVENIPAAGEPFIYMENYCGNVTVNYSIFHYLTLGTMLLNRAIATDQPMLQAVVGDGLGCYREFEHNTVFASWPHAMHVASAIWDIDKNNNQQCLFYQPPYLFAYQPSSKSTRLFQYGDQLYCFVCREKGPLQANLYQLDCITGGIQPLIDTIVGDFAVEEDHLYYIAHDRLYHYDLDTQQCTELTACQILHCTGDINTFFNHASCNHSVFILFP